MRCTMLLLASLTLLASAVAFAEGESCETDADCPQGTACVLAPCKACPDGEQCPPCEPAGECLADSGGSSGECASDADCPEGLSCEQVQLPCDVKPCACSCAPCDPDDEECPPCECDDCPPEPEPCEPQTVGYCRYNPPECESDTDCAQGFECITQERCSGGTPCMCTECVCADCPEGEECPPCDCPEEPVCDCPENPPEPECEIVGSYCLPKQIECASDADCPEDWECTTEQAPCACPGCACPPCEEGKDCPACDCPPCDCGEAEQFCIPSGWGDYIDRDGPVSSGEDSPDPHGGTTSPPTANEAPTEGGQAAGDDKDGSTPTDAGATCAVSHHGAPTTVAMLVLVLFGVGLLRRRKLLLVK